MRRLIKRRSRKAGLPPGSLVYVGDEKPEETKIALVDYDESRLREEEVKTVDVCAAVKELPTVTWINVEGLNDVDTLRRIGECFELHPLVMEDILNTDQRPRIEDHGDKLYVVLKSLRYDGDSNQVVSEQISLILGPTFVLSFQERQSDIFDTVKERIRTARGRIRSSGPDYLAYALLDVVVDAYFLALEAMGDRIDRLESELMADPTPATLRVIQTLKTDGLLVRKALWPLREASSRLARGDSPLVKEATLLYLRDLYDHTVQAVDTAESFREILAGMLDIYLSNVSNTMNSVMKVLTLVATVFMPLTLLVGIYGMNFQYMPELRLPWGYAAVWVAMICIGIGMLAYFRVRRWL